MGGLISTIEGNNMTSLKIETNDKKENKERDLVLKKYKDYYNTNGFYKVSIDLNELKKYLDSKFGKKTIEKFRIKRVEHFLDVNYGDQITKFDKSGLMYLAVGSLTGLYSITIPDKEKKSVSSVKIIFSKMFLMKNKYEELVNFLFTEFSKIASSKSENQKDINMANKNVLLYILKNINKNDNPEIFFSNLISLFIKIGILIMINNHVKKSAIPEEKAMDMIFDELSSFVPNDKCIKSDSIKFLKIDPSLCINEKTSKTGSSDCPKPDCPKKECPKPNSCQEYKSSKEQWMISAGVLLVVLIVFAILYFTKIIIL